MSQIEALEKLGLSPEEIQDVLECDRRIDKGENLFELPEDRKKVEKAMRQADRTPTAYNFQKRERKPNEDKREIINKINSWLADWDNPAMGELPRIETKNPEREIEFYFNDKKYKITLSAPRT